jgi:hypothetical protein
MHQSSRGNRASNENHLGRCKRARNEPKEIARTKRFRNQRECAKRTQSPDSPQQPFVSKGLTIDRGRHFPGPWRLSTAQLGRVRRRRTERESASCVHDLIKGLMEWTTRSILATVVVCVVFVKPVIPTSWHSETGARMERRSRGPDCQKPVQGLISGCRPSLMGRRLGHAVWPGPLRSAGRACTGFDRTQGRNHPRGAESTGRAVEGPCRSSRGGEE